MFALATRCRPLLRTVVALRTTNPNPHAHGRTTNTAGNPKIEPPNKRTGVRSGSISTSTTAARAAAAAAATAGGGSRGGSMQASPERCTLRSGVFLVRSGESRGHRPLLKHSSARLRVAPPPCSGRGYRGARGGSFRAGCSGGRNSSGSDGGGGGRSGGDASGAAAAAAAMVSMRRRI